MKMECTLVVLYSWKLNHAHTNSIEICTTAYALKFKLYFEN